MSATNRLGLGILLWVLVCIGTIIVEVDLQVTFVFGITSMVGLVLLVYGKNKK